MDGSIYFTWEYLQPFLEDLIKRRPAILQQ
jgi:hypothetical protein